MKYKYKLIHDLVEFIVNYKDFNQYITLGLKHELISIFTKMSTTIMQHIVKFSYYIMKN